MGSEHSEFEGVEITEDEYICGMLNLTADLRDQAEEELKRAWFAVKRKAKDLENALDEVVERHTVGRGEPK